MHLDHLTLNNFKNIIHAELDFSPKLNCLLGDNGMGKSNLLDAIHYLSFCKSFTGMTDMQLINRGEEFAMLAGRYSRRGADEQVNVGLHRKRRKSFRRGDKEYQRLSEHIGKFPLVLVSPGDMSLIDGASDERRRFIDMLVSQTDANYLSALIRYNRALSQRNAMLRNGVADPRLYEAVEMGMEMAARTIHEGRARRIESLSDIFSRYYSEIAGEGETVSLTYRSQLATADTSLIELLESRRERDRMLKYTSVGPHRDDIEMLLNEMPVRRTASQGQTKSYTIAMRLAQYEFLKQAVSMSPILLLDDIFDKLDAGRVERIMGIVSRDTFGQIFITDTNRKHLDEILDRCGGQYAMWTVSGGTFTPSGNNHPTPPAV